MGALVCCEASASTGGAMGVLICCEASASIGGAMGALICCEASASIGGAMGALTCWELSEAVGGAIGVSTCCETSASAGGVEIAGFDEAAAPLPAFSLDDVATLGARIDCEGLAATCWESSSARPPRDAAAPSFAGL